MAAEPMPDLSSQYLHGEVDMTLQNSRVWPWACPYYSCVHIAVILHVCRKKKKDVHLTQNGVVVALLV